MPAKKRTTRTKAVAKARERVIATAYAEIEAIFDMTVALEDEARGELQNMVQFIVRPAIERDPKKWSDVGFHNFMIGQATRIASRASEMTLTAGARPNKGYRPAIDLQTLLNAGVEVMTRTHGILEARYGSCEAAVKDGKINVFKRDDRQGRECTKWAANAALVLATMGDPKVSPNGIRADPGHAPVGKVVVQAVPDAPVQRRIRK